MSRDWLHQISLIYMITENKSVADRTIWQSGFQHYLQIVIMMLNDFLRSFLIIFDIFASLENIIFSQFRYIVCKRNELLFILILVESSISKISDIKGSLKYVEKKVGYW